MNKALKELGFLKGYILDSSNIQFDMLVKKFEIIETELKRLEEIDNRPFINGIREEIPADVICKKLKALKIIKDNINVEEILFSAKGVCNSKDYDLLKEVLKCD